MARPPLEVATIFRQYGQAYRAAHRLTRQQLRVMRAIEVCRTAVLGGHVEECGHCRYRRISYNSCRNRHCPKCQSLERARWLEARQREVLPVAYYHVVFTLPAALVALAFYNPETIYSLLFRTAAQTLLTIARDPRHLGADIGFFAILHTWGQNLELHPHLHCLVPGGGLAPDGDRWIACRPGFFLPVRVLSRRFRRLFLEAVERAYDQGRLRLLGEVSQLAHPRSFVAWLKALSKTEWVVYAKPPFGGPEQVIEYLGRYTHRVAISNSRLRSLEDGWVTFEWKDYRRSPRPQTMTLEAGEFIRRFLLHTLPPGFQRIRYYGLFANRHRNEALALCRRLLSTPVAELLPEPRRDWPELYRDLTGGDVHRCPRCGTGTLVIVETLPASYWSRPAAEDTS